MGDDSKEFVYAGPWNRSGCATFGLGTAKSAGIAIPQRLLLRADEVIQ
jgi:hypothetical protein